jgi:anti-anti-sigma factor
MKMIKAGAGAVIIALDAELTVSSEQELMDIMDSLQHDSVNNILLDFNLVNVMDNTGLNVLVKLSIRARKSRQALLAIGVNKGYLDVFDMTGLDRTYRVYTSLSEVPMAAGPSTEPEVRSILDRPGKTEECALPGSECWAPSSKKLAVPKMPQEAVNLNVHGRRTAGPLQGFGQLWEKTYSIDLSDTKLTPEEIISTLKSNFPKFQPPQNRFYTSEAGIKPGEIVLINALTPGGMIATGVLVLYARARSFTFITPQGHPEAGWVTFRSFQENDRTMMQVQGLARASDPLYEAAFRIAGSSLQEQIWTYLLESLAKHTGSSSQVQLDKQCLDTSLQWPNFFNVFLNAQISSMFFGLTHPIRKQQHAV